MIEKILFPIFKIFGLNPTKTNISWIQVLILTFVPLGQLWARIFLLNGSLDKKWLFFPFLILPPFSLIPMIMMKFGLVAKGKGLKPYDKLMFIPIVLHLIISYLGKAFIQNTSVYNVIYLLLLFGGTAGILTYRVKKNCDLKTIGAKTNFIGKNIIDSLKIVALAEIIPTVIKFFPIIGKIYSMIIMIPLIGNIIVEALWSLGYISAYTFNNMLNQDKMERYCKTPLTGYLDDKILGIISIVAILFTKFVNQF